MNIAKSFETVNVCWYKKEEWKKMKSVCADSYKLEDTFEEWEQMVTNTLHEMKKAGLIGKKVYINTDDFVAWCAIYNLPLDAASRSRFILEQSPAFEG